MREESYAGSAEDASMEAGEITRDDLLASPSPFPSSSSPHLLSVKVAHGLRLHEITLPLHSTFGVKNNSKILLLEDAASKERRLEEARQNERLAKSSQSVAHVREEVDKLAVQVSALEATVESGNKVPDSAFAMLSELLMRQLLTLDSIEAEGEAKVQRKVEVQRVQRFADAVDQLKIKNSDPHFCSKALAIYSGAVEDTQSTPASSSSTDWEHSG